MSVKPKEVIEIDAGQLLALRRRVEAATLEPEDFATIDVVLESYAYVTCELCEANPFDYLTQLQRHAEEVAAAPAYWLPWNYRDAC